MTTIPHPSVIKDELGRFRLIDNADRRIPLTCSSCDIPNRFIIMPIRLQLPNNINPEATIAAFFQDDNRIYTPLGLNCGCYGKLHRQVAHIVDRMKRAGVRHHGNMPK